MSIDTLDKILLACVSLAMLSCSIVVIGIGWALITGSIE